MTDKKLSEKDIYKVSEMAKEKRREFDIGLSPIGDNIFKFIREKKIKLIYIPIKNEGSNDLFFSSVYICLKEDGNKYMYIGLNTNDYYDNQIFALAHELYHYYEEPEIHLCRISSNSQPIRELKANRFAAEFLLPTEKLEKEIRDINDGSLKLYEWKKTTIFRFIARLHCEYKLPYKAIVRRLLEINAITDDQFELLYTEKTREGKNEYYVIGTSINCEIFKQLNTITKKEGIEGNDLENVLRNYEDDIINIDELIESLRIFDKTIEDVGIQEEVDMSDLDDMSEMFEEDSSEN